MLPGSARTNSVALGRSIYIFAPQHLHLQSEGERQDVLGGREAWIINTYEEIRTASVSVSTQ